VIGTDAPDDEQITDLPQVAELLPKALDRDSELLEGSAGQVTVVLRFATKAAAKA